MRSRVWWVGTGLVASVTVGLLAAWANVVVVGVGLILLLGLAYLALLLRYPQRGLWLLAASLPFERIGTVPLGFFTLKLGHLVSFGMLASWLARSILTKTWRFAYNPLRLPLLLYLAATVLSLTNAVNLTRSVTLILQLLIGWLVYWLTINFLDRQNLKPTLIALWVGSALVALFGLYQFVGDWLGLPTTLTGLLPQYSGKLVFGFARIQSVSLEPLYFANYLLLPILTAAAYLVGGRGRRRLLLLPLLLLLLTVLVLTLARGAYLGLSVATLLLIVMYRRRLFRSRVILVALATSALVITAVMALLVSTAGRGENPLQAFSKQIRNTGQDTSTRQRLGSIKAAQELTSEYPVTGIGLGNFGDYYQDPLTTSASRQSRQVVNNQFLETLVETGVIGLTTLLFILFVLLERTVRAFRAVANKPGLRPALVGASLAALAIFVQAQTFSALYLMHVWFAVGLLVAVQNLILLPVAKRS